MDLVKLNENRIAGALLNRIPVRVFDALDSTNDEAKRAVKNGLSEATLFLSETQTKGRGRNGHDFYSPKYEGLYMTLAYPAESFGQEILRVTAKTAVAVSRGIQETFGTEVGIKWVNDLYLGEEKAGGILVEHMSVPEWLLIGIGINVTTAKFPSDLIGKARALNPGKAADRNGLAAAITAELLKELNAPKDTAYLEEYRARSVVLGREITYERYGDGERIAVRALAESIDDDGALIVRREDGIQERLDSGEIRVRTAKGDWQ